MKLYCVLLVLAVQPAALPAQTARVQARHARVELLSSRDAARQEFLLGVRFMLEEGWHVYWINPGDSGQPPSFTWQLPEGFIAGDVMWPRPQRLQSSPMIADYGYTKDVLLLVPLHVPPSWRPSSSTVIALEAKWLICREVCIPDHAELKLELQISPPSNPSIAHLFVATKRQLPQLWPKDWKASVESRKNDFVLTIETGTTISGLQFFPLDAGQIENSAAQRVIPTRTGAKLVLQKSDLLLKPISQLRGVVVIVGEDTYQLQATVRTDAALQ